MTSADRFLSGFARSWRNEQRRLLEDFSYDDHGAYFAALQQAWQELCQQWWINMRHVVPQALTNQLDSALRQTQLCVNLALKGEQLSAADLAAMVNPVASLQAAIFAQHQHATLQPGDVAHRHLLATQAMMARIAQINQRALTAARGQLPNHHEHTPREIHAHCARVVEMVYREQVSNDEVSRLIGNWVNTHAQLVAERGATPATTPGDFAHAPQTHLDTAAAAPAPESVPRKQPDDPPNDGDGAAVSTRSWAGATTTYSLRDRLTQQLNEFSDKLAAGSTSLAALPSINCRGVTPNEVVLQCDGVQLLRYRGTSRKPLPGSASILPPLLVVYSLVNRPYILDLNKERTLIGAWCDAGRDVYLVDWGYPSEHDASLGLDDYINRYLHRCVEYLQTICELGTVDLIGICQGGPLALCYAALEPARVRRLALMLAPTDFHTDDFLLARWLRHIDVDCLINAFGNVPGYLLNWAFIALKPVSLSGMKALELLDSLDRPQELTTYTQMECWLQDNPDQAGQAFAQFTKMFVRDNALVNAAVTIGTRRVDLHAVRHNVLNIYAAHDHIVPPSASRKLPDLLANAQCSNHQVDCGHIGMLVGRRAHVEVARLIHQWFEQND